ncbi:hypothetical protein ACC761_28355, partial [Rhizobium ruizarguesonis]
ADIRSDPCRKARPSAVSYTTPVDTIPANSSKAAKIPMTRPKSLVTKRPINDGEEAAAKVGRKVFERFWTALCGNRDRSCDASKSRSCINDHWQRHFKSPADSLVFAL